MKWIQLKIYGNAFAKASERQLIQACKYLSKPQTVNLIAIEAPSHGRGAYTREQVEYILVTCYAGFKAAQVLANKTHALNTQKSTISYSRGGKFSYNNSYRLVGLWSLWK